MSCDRQEVVATVSTQQFPDPVFLDTDDFLLLVRKLFRSCRSTKRPGIAEHFPGLCEAFDNHLDNNDTIRLLSLLFNNHF